MTDPVINSSFARSPSGVGLVTVVIGSDDKRLTDTIARLEATQKQLETAIRRIEQLEKPKPEPVPLEELICPKDKPVGDPKKIVTMTDAIFKQLKIGDRVKLKSKLTAAEKYDTNTHYGWSVTKDAMLGQQWFIIVTVLDHGVKFRDSLLSFHKSNLELAEIPIDRLEKIKTEDSERSDEDASKNSKKIITMTDAVFKQLKPGYRVKLKSTLTLVEKEKTSKFFGWYTEKTEMLGNWFEIKEIVNADYVLLELGRGAWSFHKSNLASAELP